MKDDKKTDHRGGKRPGAGRPKTDSKLFTFRVPGELARVIESQESKTDFIRDCIVRSIHERQTDDFAVQPDFSRVGEAVCATAMKELHLPFFDIKVVAGFPIPLDNDEKAQDIDLIHMLCPHPESSYLIRVQGDSMVDANIQSGDIVIVDKSNRNPTESEPAMCELNDEYTIKYVQHRDGGVVLVPANPNYPEFKVTEGDDFSVWGTITYVIHRPK